MILQRENRSRSLEQRRECSIKQKYGEEGPVEDQRRKKVGQYDICHRGRGDRLEQRLRLAL